MTRTEKKSKTKASSGKKPTEIVAPDDGDCRDDNVDRFQIVRHDSDLTSDGPIDAVDTRKSNKEEDVNDTTNSAPTNRILLYKSTRLTGYITLALASFINFDAAQHCSSTLGTAVPATDTQKNYALAVSIVSATFSTLIVLMHFDRITPLQKMWWIPAFQPKSRVELVIACCFALWWSVAVGVQTSIGGVAGDGKSQFSLYCSSWVACLASFWILERWAVAAGWSSLRPFITSWPYRAPVWICIFFLSILTIIWYINLWQNHTDLTRDSEQKLLDYFRSVPDTQWRWLVIFTVFSICSAIGFVLVELFRDINEDGSNEAKTLIENYIEGITFLVLVLAWIPTVMVVTTPGGAASLVGNAYFFTWMLVVFTFEGLVWWIHDYRLEMHKAVQAKEKEYQQRQEEVLAQTRQRLKHEKEGSNTDDDDDDDSNSQGDERNNVRMSSISKGAPSDVLHESVRRELALSSEFFDAVDSEQQ